MKLWWMISEAVALMAFTTAWVETSHIPIGKWDVVQAFSKPLTDREKVALIFIGEGLLLTVMPALATLIATCCP